MVQLSHPYMTTGKTTALTIWNFVSKVVTLLFNMLSRFVIPEWPSCFPYYIQFKSELYNKELMIWATVSSWSCFCWPYRTSPSSTAKNIINLILVLTIQWCPCVGLPLALLEEGVCRDQCILLAQWTWVSANSRRQRRTRNPDYCSPWDRKESDTTEQLNNKLCHSFHSKEQVSLQIYVFN